MSADSAAFFGGAKGRFFVRPGVCHRTFPDALDRRDAASVNSTPQNQNDR
jgi:hypothetical protein